MGVHLLLSNKNRKKERKKERKKKKERKHHRGVAYPKVPITRVVTWVSASRANLASPKSETCKEKSIHF